LGYLSLATGHGGTVVLDSAKEGRYQAELQPRPGGSERRRACRNEGSEGERCDIRYGLGDIRSCLQLLPGEMSLHDLRA
jgi:hypothetical protein